MKVWGGNADDQPEPDRVPTLTLYVWKDSVIDSCKFKNRAIIKIIKGGLVQTVNL